MRSLRGHEREEDVRGGRRGRGAELSKSRGNLTPCRRVCGAETSPTCGLWHLLNLILASSLLPFLRLGLPLGMYPSCDVPRGRGTVLDPRCAFCRAIFSFDSRDLFISFFRIKMERFPTTCFDFGYIYFGYIKGTEIHPVARGEGNRHEEGGSFFERRR